MSEGADHHPSPLSVSSPRFSLSSSECSSSVQRSPPTRSRTDRVQHIQGSRSASPHPGLRRVRQRHPIFCFFFFLPLGPVLFVIPPSFHSSSPLPTPATCPLFPSAPPPQHTHATASPECQCSESAERCMPGSPHSTAHYPRSPDLPRPRPPHEPLPHFTLTACRIDRPTDRAQLRDVFSFLHALMGNLAPAAVVSLSKGCRSSEEWEGLCLKP